MKYIKFKKIGIVLFADWIEHKDMAEKIGEEPISAGRVFARNGEHYCTGDSPSLNLQANEKEDTKMLNAQGLY